MIKKHLFFICLILFGSSRVLAQRINSDTSQQIVSPKSEKKLSNVQKATLYSIIPGGGQVYNHRYWKVPVIYVGFGLLTYSFIFYNKVYGEVRVSYKESINGIPIANPEYANVPEEMLYTLRESYKKSRDLSAIGLAGWYVFNLIDAAVDAHLQEFDVSDKLTLKITPQYQFGYAGAYTGLQLRFKF